MTVKSEGVFPLRKGLFRPISGIVFLLAGVPSWTGVWVPTIDLKFESGTTSSPNTSPLSGSVSVSATTPAYVPNTAISGGAKALDFGTADGNFYADLNLVQRR